MVISEVTSGFSSFSLAIQAFQDRLSLGTVRAVGATAQSWRLRSSTWFYLSVTLYAHDTYSQCIRFVYPWWTAPKTEYIIEKTTSDMSLIITNKHQLLEVDNQRADPTSYCCPWRRQSSKDWVFKEKPNLLVCIYMYVCMHAWTYHTHMHVHLHTLTCKIIMIITRSGSLGAGTRGHLIFCNAD